MNPPALICLPFCSDCSLQRFEKRERSHKPSAVPETFITAYQDLAFCACRIED